MPNGFLFNLYKRTATSDTITYYFGSVFPNVLNVTNTKLIYTVAGADTETAKAGFDSVPLTADKIPLTSTDKTPVTTALKYRCNPNLLDNWYFGRPVNQRGKTEYTTTGYTVDRWRLDIGGAVTIEDGCICLKKSGTYWGEYFADFDQFIGMTLTGSVLLSDDTLRTGSFVYNGLLNQGQTFFSSELGFYVQALSDSLTQCEINSNVDNVKIKAVKLELGDTQTLAHKENEKWVLNEIPDFGEQLARCQRYALKIGDASRYCSLGTGVARDEQFVSFTFPTPVTMRTVPSLVAIPVGFTMRHDDSKLSGGTEFLVDAASQNSIMLKVKSQVALTIGEAWEAFLAPNGVIIFSADL